MKRFLACLFSGVVLLAGCTAVPAPAAPVATAEPIAAPASYTGDFAPMTAFAAALFARTLENGEQNPVLSPASAYLCLAMVQNGANTDTLAEFEALLGEDTDTLNRMCRAFAARLADTRCDTVLSLADAVFADDDRVHLNEAYLQTLRDSFDAAAFTVDLPSDAAREAVNAWVSEKTHGLIPTLHEENFPDDTVLVLLNTLYFNARWQDPFREYNTRDHAFTTAAGGSVNVPFMGAYLQTLPVVSGGGAEGVVLPYNDGKTVFLALLPDDGDARALAGSLTPDTLWGYLTGAQDALVNLLLPKFSVEYGINMNGILRDMGLSLAFDANRADLTRMGAGENGPLYLSWVIQRVKLTVDEKGTEAAAVTEAAVAEGAALTDPPKELYFDRPFVYAVLDTETGVPLFLGLMEDPSAAQNAAAPDAPAPLSAPVLDAVLYEHLRGIRGGYFPGTAGCSLTAARLAGQLLDYATAVQPEAETVSATVQAFFITLSDEDAALFEQQLTAVCDTAKELLTGDAEDLLSSAGFLPVYDWQPDAMQAFLAALTASCG